MVKRAVKQALVPVGETEILITILSIHKILIPRSDTLRERHYLAGCIIRVLTQFIIIQKYLNFCFSLLLVPAYIYHMLIIFQVLIINSELTPDHFWFGF